MTHERDTEQDGRPAEQAVVDAVHRARVALGLASHVAGPWFAPRSGHTKDHHRYDTNCLPAWHEVWEFGSAA